MRNLRCVNGCLNTTRCRCSQCGAALCHRLERLLAHAAPAPDHVAGTFHSQTAKQREAAEAAVVVLAGPDAAAIDTARQQPGDRKYCHFGSCRHRITTNVLCTACDLCFCISHVQLHSCLGVNVWEVIDFNTHWGRMWWPEEFRMSAALSEHEVGKAQILSIINSRDARLLNTPELHNHRMQQPIQELLHDLGGDDYFIAAFAATGSGANNMLEPLAQYIANKDLRAGEPRREGCVLVMKGAVVAPYGSLAAVSSRSWPREHVRLFGPAHVTKQVCSAVPVQF